MALTKTHKQLIDEATARIETVPVADAVKLHGDPGVVFVDIRDVRELEREGMIPGALHAPRGMLEFWIDPTSPYYKDVFGSGKKFIFYCQSAWRSALATRAVGEMGLQPVCHIAGGFRAWKEGGGPVAAAPEKQGGGKA
ncbi:MAG: rhodanese-like domain-containing protein [Rhodospirillales bacterium]|nr:rhodanese-like domain-containing protein [Rhodospirillales bacterium]